MLIDRKLTSHRVMLLLLLLLLALLLINLGKWGVIETSEARYAEISRGMLLSNDWLHPRLLGIQHFHKPPVTYIISALGMKIFGANAFGARFFLQISLVLQGWLVYLIGRQLFKEKAPAKIALIVYITIPAVLVAARNLTTDSFLTTFELAAILSWLLFKNARRFRWLYLFYFFLAIAFLTKGPVGLIFPVLICLVYHSESKPLAPKPGHYLSALLLFLALGFSWYIYLVLQDKQFIEYFFFKHTVQRVSNPATFGRSKPWWFYLVLVPVLSLPWSAILVFQFKEIKQLPRKALRLLLIWIFVPLLFFSLSSSKLILYVLPLFAGIALLTGYLLHSLQAEKLKKNVNFSLLFYLVLALALALTPLLPVNISVPGWTIIFPAFMIIGLIFIWHRPMLQLYKLLAAATLFVFLLTPFSTYLLAGNPELTKSGYWMAAFIEKQNLENRKVIVYDQLLPSLAFHLQKDILSVYDSDKNLIREIQFERNRNWRRHYLNIHDKTDETRLKSLLKQNSVLILKGEAAPEKAWMIKQLPNKKQFGRWYLYY